MEASKVCLFCCKLAENAAADQIPQQVDIFFNFLERYYGKGKTFAKLHDNVQRIIIINGDVGMCGDCAGLVQVICDLHNQLKRTELQLQWKFGTLLSIIKLANRVPSRLTLARQIFSATLIMKCFTEMRNQLLHKCTKRAAKVCQPKVALKRISALPVIASESVAIPKVDSDLLETQHYQTSSEDGEFPSHDFETEPFLVEQKPIVSLSSTAFNETDADNEPLSEKAKSETETPECQQDIVADPVIKSEQIKQKSTKHYYCKICKQIFATYSLYLSHCSSTCHKRKLKCKTPKLTLLNKNKRLHRQKKNIKVCKPTDSTTVEPQQSKYQLRKRLKTLPISNNFEHESSSSSSDEDDAVNISCVDSSSTSSYSDADYSGQEDNCQIEKPPNRRKVPKRFKREKCPICQVSLNVKLVQDHVRRFHDTTNVDPANILRCSENDCKAYFTSSKYLDFHHRQMHRFKCVMCKMFFKELELLDQHKKEKHKILQNSEESTFKSRAGNLLCTNNECSMLMESTKDLRRHLKLHGSFKCEFCSTIETYAPNLSLHELTHNLKLKQEMFSCQRCNYKTEDEKLYILHHLKIHLNLKDRIACKICGEKFVERKDFHVHNSKFHGYNKSTVITCNQCSAYFLDGAQVAYHKHRQHMPTYTCVHASCNATFKFPINLQLHENLHEVLTCKFCSKTYDFAEDLAFHELEHVAHNDVNSENLKCPRCSKTEPGIQKLVTHFVQTHLCLQTDRLDTQRCTTCELMKTKQEWKLESHKKICHGDKTSPEAVGCDQCSSHFRTKRHLLDHKKLMHADNPLMCKICKEIFETPEMLHEHTKLHGQFSCNFCNVKKKYARDLAIHELLQHGEIKEDISDNSMFFKCSRCVSLQNTNNRYVSHFIKTHLKLNPNVYICNICKKGYPVQLTLHQHKIQFHKVDGAFSNPRIQCDECPVYFRKEIQLSLHKQRVHKTKKLFSCKICKQVFNSRHSLDKHRSSLHDQPDKWKFVCPASDCTKKFATKILLQTHMRIHDDSEYKFVCKVTGCKKQFVSDEELTIHTKFDASAIHYKTSGVNVSLEDWRKEIVKCEVCGTEKKRAGIVAHMKAYHMKVRPTEFKCEQCDKVFTRKGNLETHQVFHRGPEEWAFTCSICSKRCPFKRNLEQHMRTHTKEKPFVCQICGEKYAHRHNLRNHVNSKHKDEGVQDIAKPKGKRRFYVSRKGKKLNREFCFIKEQK